MARENFESIMQDNGYNMLDIIFNARAEELSNMISNDIKAIEKTAKKTNQEYAVFKSNLDKISDEYRDIKRNIIDAFNEYSNALEYREGYFNEKYYKSGVKDAFNILMNCVTNK
ncbi:MAG: hypothetical protein IKT41_00220 [Clostridia bacterium]|nr:hypothetical protein [Clostridia bacterium]